MRFRCAWDPRSDEQQHNGMLLPSGQFACFRCCLVLDLVGWSKPCVPAQREEASS